MDWTSGNVFELGGVNYIIMTDLNRDGKHYLFVNKMLDEEKIGENYYIALEQNEEVMLISDDKLIGELLPIFQEKVLKFAKEITE